jgi:DNA-binding transcriptional LysR family regulator
MNYSHIELILAIADAGSISEAADNLFVSQPFLSSALKRVEEEIGTPLFTRSKSGTSLTPFGHEYIRHASRISNEIETLNNLYRATQVPKMRLNMVSMGFCFLYTMFAEIRQKYQKFPCSFYLAEASAADQIRMVSEGKYEAGLIVLDEEHKRQIIHSIRAKGLDYIRLGHPKTGIYVSKHSKIFPKNVTVLNQETVKHLVGMPFVSIYARQEDMHSYKNWREFESLILSHESSYIASSTGMRTDLINLYDGFGTASYCAELYEKYPFTEDLRFIPFAPEFDLGYELAWIQPQNQPRSTLANELFMLLNQ